METTRKQDQKPVIDVSKRRSFTRIVTISLALFGTLLGGAILLIDVWLRSDVVATTTAHSSVANAADDRPQTVR